MVTDRVRHYQEKQEADRSVGQSQEVEVTVFHVDLHAGVACRKGDQHQEPVGEMRPGKEQRREQRHVPRIRREGLQSVRKMAVQHVLLQQAPR